MREEEHDTAAPPLREVNEHIYYMKFIATVPIFTDFYFGYFYV
jgi:hypothetical protein